MQQQLFKVRDKRNKGWFYLDNEYLNGIGKNLGPIGIAVYVSLCRHADNEQKCFPSQETIAKEIGAGVRSVRNYLKKLEELNIIQLEKVRTAEGKWLNNTYFLLDKTEWNYPKATGAYGNPEANKDIAIGNRIQNHRQQVPIKDTNINNTNNNNIATQRVARKDQDIFEIIELFNFNPSYKKFFGNITQRKAVERLSKEHGEKLKEMIKVLPKTNKMQYAPIITTPLQLEDKLASLVAFIGKKRSEINKNKIAKIQ